MARLLAGLADPGLPFLAFAIVGLFLQRSTTFCLAGDPGDGGLVRVRLADLLPGARRRGRPPSSVGAVVPVARDQHDHRPAVRLHGRSAGGDDAGGGDDRRAAGPDLLAGLPLGTRGRARPRRRRRRSRRWPTGAAPIPIRTAAATTIGTPMRAAGAGPRPGLRPLLRLPWTLHRRDARSGPLQQPPGHVHVLGRRWPRVVFADRVLVQPDPPDPAAPSTRSPEVPIISGPAGRRRRRSSPPDSATSGSCSASSGSGGTPIPWSSRRWSRWRRAAN